MVNHATNIRVENLPFGGTKLSGNAREGLHETLLEMTEQKTLLMSDVFPMPPSSGVLRLHDLSKRYDGNPALAGVSLEAASGSTVAICGENGAGKSTLMHPEVGLGVAVVEPGRALVLRGGVPMGAAPPPYDFTWAFVLQGQPEGTTRLLVRERYAYTQQWAPLLVEPVAVVTFVMTHKMLRGIRERADAAAGQRHELGRGDDDGPVRQPLSAAECSGRWVPLSGARRVTTTCRHPGGR